jgi:hypothetical protein
MPNLIPVIEHGGKQENYDILEKKIHSAKKKRKSMTVDK